MEQAVSSSVEDIGANSNSVVGVRGTLLGDSVQRGFGSLCGERDTVDIDSGISEGKVMAAKAEESEVTLELEIEQLLENGIRAQGQREGANREKGYHVSGLSYDCMRNIQLSQMEEQEETRNLEPPEEEFDDGTYRMWIGTMLHQTPLTPKHEWGVYKVFNVDGKLVRVNGHIDEIYQRKDGTEVVVDKKFVASVPRSPNEHHKRQVSYYAAMLADTGAAVNTGAILYFSPVVNKYEGKERIRVFSFPIDTKAAAAEMEERVQTIQRAIDSKTMVPRNPHWLCLFCKFRKECIAKDGPITVRAYGKVNTFTE